MRTFAVAATSLIWAGLLSGCGAAPDSTDDEDTSEAESALGGFDGTLKKADKAFQWNGTVNASDASPASYPAECQGPGVECDHFRLKVNLPNDTFDHPNKPGGVQFAARWFGDPGPQTLPPGVPGCCGEFDALNLYVYKGGTLRASSVGIIATSVSATIDDAENGIYDVYIQTDPQFNVHPSVDYEAYAEVQYDPKINPTRELLPDIEFLSARTVTFEHPVFDLFEPNPPPDQNCFDSEIEEDGAINCLRFDQVIENTGKAALELRFALPHDPNDPATNVYQRVYSSDGSTDDQPGGTWEFHEAHHHYHYNSFTVTDLWKATHSGSKVGSAPLRHSQKKSFCVADVEIEKWAGKHVGDRKYQAPDCLFPQDSDANYDYLVQGMSAGWADIYEWYLPGQYVEAHGLADGYYILESCADPDHDIEEKNENNNCSQTLIHLTGVDTPSQHAENLGEVNSCHGGGDDDDDDDDGGHHGH